MGSMRRLLGTDMPQLSERDKVTLVVAYLVGGGLSGVSFGVAILSRAPLARLGGGMQPGGRDVLYLPPREDRASCAETRPLETRTLHAPV